MACEMLEPCEFRPLIVACSCSCGPTRKLNSFRTQTSVLCSKQEVQRSFLRHFVSKAWTLFSECFTEIGIEGDKRLVQLKLACKLMLLLRQILFNRAIAAIVEAIQTYESSVTAVSPREQGSSPFSHSRCWPA